MCLIHLYYVSALDLVNCNAKQSINLYNPKPNYTQLSQLLFLLAKQIFLSINSLFPAESHMLPRNTSFDQTPTLR
jgi:hypothetical protein